MPKIVDHKQRRLDIGDAVLEVVASEGVERLTVRKIAAVSGWSTGVLAHYARDKDDMIDLAVTSMVTRFAVRLQAIDTSDTRRALRDVLAELLPLDATRRTEAMAWARLATHDADGSGSARDVREGHRELRRHVASLLADIDEGHDPSVTATELIALADGLAVHHLIDPHGMPRTRIEATLDARLAQI
ncbi:MAG TPA: TetR family transcriptional regulator C-terminal domain-containing protein [Nocardioidaceae bacterium]|nr:TetR family transcriptional regulator C-terminal domain-containing protein [Nocardioidaceae bacterium]